MKRSMFQADLDHAPVVNTFTEAPAKKKDRLLAAVVVIRSRLDGSRNLLLIHLRCDSVERLESKSEVTHVALQATH